MKRWSASLVIREMQFKTIIRSVYTHWDGNYKKNITSVGGYREILAFIHCWECKMVHAAFLENNLAAPQKVKHCHPAFPFLGIYSRKLKNTD
jgi:hypothetical protein